MASVAPPDFARPRRVNFVCIAKHPAAAEAYSTYRNRGRGRNRWHLSQLRWRGPLGRALSSCERPESAQPGHLYLPQRRSLHRTRSSRSLSAARSVTLGSPTSQPAFDLSLQPAPGKSHDERVEWAAKVSAVLQISFFGPSAFAPWRASTAFSR